MKRFMPYSTPKIYVILGFVTSIIQGAVMPLFGCVMAKVLFSY